MAKGHRPEVYQKPDKDYIDTVRAANLPVSDKIWFAPSPVGHDNGDENQTAGNAPPPGGHRTRHDLNK